MNRQHRFAAGPSWAEFVLWCLPAAMVLAAFGAAQVAPKRSAPAIDVIGYSAPANERWVAKARPAPPVLTERVGELQGSAYYAAALPGGK